jgi:hypothetical protein
MKSIHPTKSFEIDIPIGKVFPLFSPEGEKLWVPEWDYINIMGNTQISENYVFLTKTTIMQLLRRFGSLKNMNRNRISFNFTK